MSLSVFIVRPMEDWARKHLEGCLTEQVSLVLGPEMPDPAEYDLAVTGSVTHAILTASPRLRAVIIPWTGVSEETAALVCDFPHVSVHNLHYNAAAVAESAIALLLAAAKFLVPYDIALRAGDWSPRYGPSPSVLLGGKTAVILGYGEIGRRVGAACQGLGMKVVGVRRNPSRTIVQDGIEVHGPDALDEVLPRADVLVVCLPETSQTRGIIGEERLAMLPDRAVLVNVGRGPVVEEEALYRALRDGSVYAAGLDVWWEYPSTPDTRSNARPSRFPFHELENVVMSPHRAALAGEAEYMRMEDLARLLNAAARGEPIPNRVDLGVGY